MHTSVGGKCLPLGHPPLLRILGNLEILDVDDNFQTLNKKRLHLISDGIPIGLMVLCYHQDLATFAKELNPAAQGWQGQTEDAKKRFLQRVNAKYRYVGEACNVSE